MDRKRTAVDAGHPEWAELPATQSEAYGTGVHHYFTGIPCKHGHVAPRQRSGRGCMDCARAYQQGEAARAAKLRYSRSEHGRAVIRRYQREFWIGSPGDRADVRKYELGKKKAAPSWLTPAQLAEMRAVYAQASDMAEATGVPHHVDHVIPLRHPLVCGLHVPWNLQVLTAEENMRKGNTFDVTYANERWREALAAGVAAQ